MAKGQAIDLHGVNREIQSVQQRLQVAATGASATEQRRIAGIIRKLESIRARTAKMCPKAWGVFPAGVSTGKAPAKPARKTRRR